MATATIQMQFAGRTDVGLIREHNEDNLVVVDLDRGAAEPLEGSRTRTLAPGSRGALLMVCDGMGGAAAGEVASQMAIEAITKVMIETTAAQGPLALDTPAPTRFARGLRNAAYEANRRIFDAARADDSHAGMGTTMTSVGVIEGELVMAQVGDSRAYILRRGVLTQVTRDQSLVNQLVETGQITEEQARMFEHSNVILQALGVQEDVEVLLSTVPLRQGDRVVVCTDGLTGVVTDEEVAAVLGGTDDMDDVCRILIEMARGAGGPDNITVVAARFDSADLPAPTESDPIAYIRWRLDEPEPPPAPPFEESAARASGAWPAVKRRPDPARTFFSVAVLLALTLGGAVMAKHLRRAGGTVRCLVLGSPGLAIHVDGHDVGLRTLTGGTALKLPPGRHRVELRQRGTVAAERAVQVATGESCRVMFEGDSPSDPANIP